MNDTRDGFIACIVAMLIAMSFGFVVGICVMKGDIRTIHAQSVDRGFAEWRAGENGKPEWQWKENK